MQTNPGGRIDKQPGLSIAQLAAEYMCVTSWSEVRRLLGDRATVQTAIQFYRGALRAEFGTNVRGAYSELLGIDYSSPVATTMLRSGSTLLTYCNTKLAPSGGPPPTRPGHFRTNAKGVREQAFVGKFLTDSGTSPTRLGIFTGSRVGVKVRILKPIQALKSRAAGVIDAWSDVPPEQKLAIPRMVSGGGAQYRIPRSMTGPDYLQVL